MENFIKPPNRVKMEQVVDRITELDTVSDINIVKQQYKQDVKTLLAIIGDLDHRLRTANHARAKSAERLEMNKRSYLGTIRALRGRIKALEGGMEEVEHDEGDV